MLQAIHDYKTKDSPEAKFVYALDKLHPTLIDYTNEGRGWREGADFAAGQRIHGPAARAARSAVTLVRTRICRDQLASLPLQ